MRNLLSEISKEQIISGEVMVNIKIIPYLLFILCITTQALSIDTSVDNTQSIVSNTPETFVQNDGTIYNISGGIPDNQTLLHLFHQFNIYKGEQAIFHDKGFTNTVAKVNGSTPSWINGYLKSSADNFFLINSNGLIFGPDASLDVAGSFFATTADEINFDNTMDSDLTSSLQSSVLRMAPVISFGFLDNTIADIEIKGSVTQAGLKVGENHDLSFIGGHIGINDKACLQAPDGGIRLISIGQKGTVQLRQNDVYMLDITQFGNIDILEESILDTSGQGGGNVFIRANILTVNNSKILAVTEGSIDGGFIDISASDILFTNGGYIDSSTSSFGNAGTIQIIASDHVSFIGENDSHQVSGIALSTLSTQPDSGNAGKISIHAAHVSFQSGASINSATLGTGHGGEIQINATETITFTGQSFLGKGSRMEVASLYLFEGAGGAGSIHLEAKDIHFEGSGIALINSTTDGPGMSGHVHITAHETFSLFGDPSGSGYGLIIAGSWLKRENGGTGGDVSIKAKNMELRNFAMINTSTDGQGIGGIVDIDITETAIFDNHATIQVVTSSKEAFAGDGGNLSLKAKNLILKNGSTINSTSFGHGKAGEIHLDVTEEIILLDSSITGEVSLDSNGGNGNLVEIKAKTITLLNDSKISTTSDSIGDAGNIRIDTDLLLLFGKSRIISKTTNAIGGNAGTIKIETQNLLIDGPEAMISTSSNGSGMGGSIIINAEQIDIQSGRITSESLYAPNTTYESFEKFQQKQLTTGDFAEFPVQDSLIWYYIYKNQMFYMDQQYFFVRSIEELDNLVQKYNITNGDVAWMIDSEGQITQYIRGSWYRGRGWSPVDESLEPYVFNSIDEIYQLTGDFGPDEPMPYPDGARLTYKDPVTHQTTLFIYCQSPRNNDVGFFARPVRVNQFLIQNENQLSELIQQYDLKDQAVAFIQNELGEIESTYLLHSNEWIRINAIRLFENAENAIAHLSQPGDIAGFSVNKPEQVYTGKDWIDRQNTYKIDDISELPSLNARDGDIAKLSGIDANNQTYLYFDHRWHPFFQSGNAGTIDIKGSQLLMDNQSAISTSTAGNGHAGNIVLDAIGIHLNHQSQITSESISLFAGGQAGSVVINQSENAGVLKIVNFSGVLTDSVSSGGGKISIKTNQTILLNSQITTSVKDGFGNGGDISLVSRQFVLNRSRVSANAIDGDGGAIFIVSDYFIKSAETVIEASSKRGNEGTVKIDAPDLDIDSKIMNLPTDFLNASKWMRTKCSKRDSRDASRLVYKKYSVPPMLDIYQSAR
jgi:filamentous hemagglutinin family protein